MNPELKHDLDEIAEHLCLVQVLTESWQELNDFDALVYKLRIAFSKKLRELEHGKKEDVDEKSL